MPDDKRIALISLRLGKLGRHILGRKLLYGFLLLAALFMAGIIFATISHGLFYLPIWFRVGFVALMAVIALVLLAALIILPVLRKDSSEALALMVEKKYPQLKSRLIAALQFESKLLSNRENYSPALIDYCIAQAEDLTREIDFLQSYRSSRVASGLKYFGVTAVLTAALILISPGLFSSSWQVFSHPLREIPREISYNLTVYPKSADVLKFDNLDINALVFGSKLPGEARIFWKITDEWRSEPVVKQEKIESLPESGDSLLSKAADTTLFKYNFKEIRHDFQYYVEAGDRRSEVFNVRVVDKPRINNIKLTYFFPKYTGLSPVVVDENDGTIQALKGTSVKIEAELNKPVESGKIIFDNGDTLVANINGSRLEETVRVMKNDSYHIQVSDNSGHQNPDPIKYRVFMQEDNYPQVNIVKPGGNIDLDDYTAFDLAAALMDDYGFSRLALHYVVHLSPLEVHADSIEFQFDRKKTSQLIEFYWDLSNKGLYPGSYVDYYFQVWDNDNISGPKSAVSRIYTARQPSIEEMFVDIEEAREEMISDMVEALREQSKLKEQAKELHEDLQFQDEVKWETQKDIEKVKENQQELSDNLMKMAEQFDKLNQQAKDKNLLSLEMIQKLNELQKLFDQVATPEMKEAQKKLQEALDKMDKNEMEKAMKDYEMSMEDVMDNLDRAIEQLKQFQVEQKMQAMIAMAEKILENQNHVNDEADKADKDELPRLKGQEDQNTSDMKQLKKESEDLRDLLKENKLDSDPNTGEFCKAVEENDAEQDMQEMSENLQNQQKQNAQKSGKTASAKIEDMLARMKDSQSNFNNEMSAETAEKMRKAVDDLLYLSDQQESLYNEILPLGARSPLLPEYTQKQQDLKSEAERLREELREIARQSVFIQSALDDYMKGVCNSMESSVSSLSEKNGRGAVGHQEQGIYSLNQSAQTLIESLNSQSQCNSSCSNNQSMFKKMNSLSKGQKKINKQTQNQCNNPSDKPGKPNPEAMRRLAAQQQQVRNGISEMVDEFGDRKDVAGRLDKLAEEMKKVVESLEAGDVGGSTLERQKQIYSRMLDFQLSLEQRDYSEKRRAESGEEVMRGGPGDLDLARREMESAYRAKIEKFMDESYPPEYESLVRDYYKALLQSQNK